MAVSFETNAEPIPGYRLMGRLGSGGFGEVWKCEAPGGIFKAMKVIYGDLRHKDNDAYRFAEQELKSMKRVKTVRHPYLLALDRYDIVEGRLCIVMELADCNLWDRFRECRAKGLPGIPRPELMQYLFESAEVLDLMNDTHQLQHLDIKPQNLFLLYNHVKVADFGQVKDLELHVAQVTGGITPVYAAPETFDGLVSRYCDQYSLACVYQELLTGQRPFDGGSMTQLMMQHLQHAPNLEPSPVQDRAALGRALSKKPEDRFYTVLDMARALRDGMAKSVPARLAPSAAPHAERMEPLAAGESNGNHTDITGCADAGYNASDSSAFHAYTERQVSAGSNLEDTVSDAVSFTPMPVRSPVPEVLGDGVLRPALILGLGHTGVLLARRFRKLLEESYDEPDRLPIIRVLAIDTDAPNLEQATKNSGNATLATLPEEGTVPIPLNRAAYYLRPRANGRAVFEGWLDSNVLHRLPRTPETTGLRSLGRLAFYDHYRTLLHRVLLELDTATTATAMQASCEATQEQLRTNQPVVYLVAGLGGGTGSGIAIDLAYAIRAHMRQYGYARPEIVGVLLVPPAQGEVSLQARANAHAALTELHHYSLADTKFQATTDDASILLEDVGPPFSRTILLPGLDSPSTGASAVTQTQLPSRRRAAGLSSTAAVSGQHRVLPRSYEAEHAPIERVAQFLRCELLTPLGQRAEEKRAKLPKFDAPMFATFGLERFSWARHAVVKRAASVIAPVLLGHWIDPDPAQVRKVVPQWTLEHWANTHLEHDRLLALLKAAGDDKLGFSVEERAQLIAGGISPNGWMKRLPEPHAVAAKVQELTAIFGPPRDHGEPGPLLEAIHLKCVQIKKHVVMDWMAMIPALLDTSTFRLAGTEEVVRQLLVALERNRVAAQEHIADDERAASLAFDRLTNYGYQSKGGKKLGIAEFTEALTHYPVKWYAAAIAKQMAALYTHLHDVMLNRLNELSACRHRIQERHQELLAEGKILASLTPTAELLPLGCETVEDAAQRYLQVLNDDDLNELENRFQEALTKQMGGVYETCVNSAEGPVAILKQLRLTTQEYLDRRLGDIDLYGMMKQRYGSTNAVGQAIVQSLLEAEPKLVGRGPWAKAEVCVYLAPPGPGGVPITQQATSVLPPTAVLADLPDEVVFYREHPQVPLSALDQFGPAWRAAYKSVPEQTQVSPHCRTDVTRWSTVD